MSGLENKVALVTGSARRIGAVIVRTLHEEGANVVVHYRSSSEAAKALCAELNNVREHSCMMVQGDLTDIATLAMMIEEIIKKMGQLDILVNN
ncbi:PREDICTED: 3-oxoacyl-[acyl-carrier-protein] reductase FabG-like, partial [Priapulus caudatus]|uniref:3-oxoacyl-[acyl-carrier-protein] reductase FabG-like n=1 Tax=Priapulus caudatus TaxID=37621 RepID=A0ABM1F837_PRICU